MRFYPPEIPPFALEPTSERFEITRVADGIGLGVVARCNFDVGDEVFAFTGEIVPDATQFSLQRPDGRHVHDPYFMGRVLHSCDPNCVVDMDRCVFVARRPITPGELVTMDYDQTEDVLFRAFDCRCGAANCRGHIAGRRG